LDIHNFLGCSSPSCLSTIPEEGRRLGSVLYFDYTAFWEALQQEKFRLVNIEIDVLCDAFLA